MEETSQKFPHRKPKILVKNYENVSENVFL